MHCAKESCTAASFSMKEKVPRVTAAMACMASASWSVPSPNI